jgi:threonine dehydrogenase-like Zn-dependent dehydrogenase
VRAFVITGPGASSVLEVPAPEPAAGEVVVDVARVGVCGTDVELFTGEMSYLHDGHAAYPLRIGHEWCGTVSAVASGVERAWVGRRVAGDTMLGCGRCAACRAGRGHVCAEREEVGIRNGRAGALAEQLAVPVSSLHPLPDAVDDAAGAMAEPGGNALRAARATEATAGDRVLVLGPGTIGLLAAGFLRATGVEVHVAGVDAGTRAFARTLGVDGVWEADALPELEFAAVIDATNGAGAPAQALARVRPGGRLVLIGLAGTPSLIDTRALVLADVTAVGILSGSPALAGAIAAYAAGDVDPRPLVAATVGLEEIGEVLGGGRPRGAGQGPKVHCDPRPS